MFMKNKNFHQPRLETYTKDPVFSGIYVKRCKCGARPYYDRIYPNFSHWVACRCGVKGKSDKNLLKAIENWNNGSLVGN